MTTASIIGDTGDRLLFGSDFNSAKPYFQQFNIIAKLDGESKISVGEIQLL